MYTEYATALEGAINHIALNVDDIDQVYSKALNLNLNIVDTKIQYLPFFESGVKYFTVIGPNNEKIEFNQKIL